MPSAATDTRYLKFGTTNSKLAHLPLVTFTIPAGTTCPGACACRSKFDRKIRKIVDGPNTTHRCYAASLEAARPSVRRSTDHNLERLLAAKTREAMAELIAESINGAQYHSFFSMVRIHAGGDFFNEEYFRAWLDVARDRDDMFFYAYTKSLPFWVNNMDQIPENLVLTASRSGKHDPLIREHGLKNERVVGHPEEAAMLGLPIDHDDSYARDPGINCFALLLHGAQPKGTEAAAALKRMKSEDISFSYGPELAKQRKIAK